MTPCHHSNSRRFRCACGLVREWDGDGDVLYCRCGRIHHRSKDGPIAQSKPCEGINWLEVQVDWQVERALQAMS
jgi:hypothetical protein